MGKVKLTIDVQLVDFSLDRPLILRLSRNELAFEGSDQTSTDRVELGVKFRSVHLPSLAVRLVIYVLFSIAEGGRLTCCGELVELLRGCGREVDKSREYKFLPQYQETFWCLLWVTSAIVKVEAFRCWRDGPATERRTVEGKGFAQSLQLGVGSHGRYDVTHIYCLYYGGLSS